jgi:hypothetical protein
MRNAQIEWLALPPYRFSTRARLALCAVVADLRDLAYVRVLMFRHRYGI